MKSLYVRVHPTHPQKRLVQQMSAVIDNGGVIVSPTDASYSLVCKVGHKASEDRIRQIRHVAKDHYFTLLCADVSALAQYGKVSNSAYRLIKLLTPGPYTFILPATKETPRRLHDPKRKMVGLRVPAHPFAHALLESINEPLLCSTLMNDALELPYAEPEDINNELGHAVDAVVDAGAIGIDMTTVLDLSGNEPELVRQGKGAVSHVADFA